MPARRNAIPTEMLSVWLPQDIHARAALHLYSDVEGRIPKGAWQGLISRLLRDFFEGATLDLAPYAGTAPGTVVLRGTRSSIEMLRNLLENRS